MTKINKTMNQPLVLLLFVSLLAFQPARGQDEASIETRSASNDKVNPDGGNQARTIYSQPRYLSPHKMMHFGKRPVYYEPPMISSPIRLTRDLLPAVFNRPQKFLSLEFGSGKTLQEVPEEVRADMDSLLYSYVGQPETSYAPKKSSELERQQRQMEYMQMMDKPRLLNLISNEQASENNNSNNDNRNNEANNLEKAQGSSNSQFDEQVALQHQQQQQQQQQQQRAINVNTRSSQRVILPKKYITELLAGNRQNYAQSLPSGFGTFNKKAEPKDNFFMHFGRK